MPCIVSSSYIPPRFFQNPHIQTIFPAIFRIVKGVTFWRERISTPDDDFLDLDWSQVNSRRLVILSHGLEGSSRQHYMLGMARAFNRAGFNVLSWNNRGCSGEINRKEFSYHCGSTNDLHTVIEHAMSCGQFNQIVLVGFSLGGNLILKYVGECGTSIDARITRAIAFSAPIDVGSCAPLVTAYRNRLYFKAFMYSLRRKLKAKSIHFPEIAGTEIFSRIASFKDFDDIYTAPLFGFADAEEYWTKASAKSYLKDLAIPTLLVNAKDDPLLSESCFPFDIAKDNSLFHFEMPERGGHVGFVQFNRDGEFWSESRAVEFATMG